MLKFDHASRATQGARPYQEDAADVWPGDGPLAAAVKSPPPADTAVVAILADGMGGHVGGALASGMACSSFLETFARGENDVVDRLAQSLAEANRSIMRKVDSNPQLNGMGCTLVGVAFGAFGAHWISVGDSPLYLFRKGELTRVNEDHSLAPLLDKLAAEGRMSPDDARNDPRRHYLRSAVTGEDLDLIDASVNPLALEAGDIVLVASDGIHTLEEDEIRRLLTAYGNDSVGKIADALLRDVTSAGDPFQDNTTVIVVRASAA